MAGAAFLCLLGIALNVNDSYHDLVAHPYWYTIPVTVTGLFWLAWSSGPWRQGWGATAWCALLLVDAFALVFPIVGVRKQSKLYEPSACVRFLEQRRDEHGRVFDMYSPDQDYKSPFGDGAPLAMTQQIEAVRGYNPLDIARLRDFLQFVADRRDQMFPCEVLPEFPLVNRSLVDLLGIRYRLQPDGRPEPGTGWRPLLKDEFPIPAYHHGNGGFPICPLTRFTKTRRSCPGPSSCRRLCLIPHAKKWFDTLKCINFRETVLIDHRDTSAIGAPDGSFRRAHRGVSSQPSNHRSRRR